MTRTRLITALAALIVPLAAIAQTAVPAPPVAPVIVPAPARLEPFVAQYKVYKGSSELGDATLQLVRQPGNRWRVDLLMRGGGLFRIAGVHADQSTVFDASASGQTYRPLTQATVRKLAFTRRRTTGLYDWQSRTARWSGDVKESRSRPVALQPGDMSGLLINLAVIRDAIAMVREMGVVKGDRVALAMRNTPEWPVIFFAAVSIGAILVLANATFLLWGIFVAFDEASAIPDPVWETIEGALTDRDWRKVSREERTALLLQLDERLDGLR